MEANEETWQIYRNIAGDRLRLEFPESNGIAAMYSIPVRQPGELWDKTEIKDTAVSWHFIPKTTN